MVLSLDLLQLPGIVFPQEFLLAFIVTLKERHFFYVFLLMHHSLLFEVLLLAILNPDSLIEVLVLLVFCIFSVPLDLHIRPLLLELEMLHPL